MAFRGLNKTSEKIKNCLLLTNLRVLHYENVAFTEDISLSYFLIVMFRAILLCLGIYLLSE